MSHSTNNLSRISRWPLFICGFRPFFTLTLLTALTFLALWSWILGQTQISVQTPMTGGWTLWHGHEMLMGAGAATVGFLLNAVPEFTHTAPLTARRLALLTVLWITIRISYFFSSYWSVYPAIILSLCFWGLFLQTILPAIITKAQGRHRSFAFAVLALTTTDIAFLISLLRGDAAYPWLYLMMHVFMVLIVLAASRISMNVVNGKLQMQAAEKPNENNPYLARPPRRKLVIGSIVLCAGAEFFWANNVVTGWIAMATMASIFNLLNDWHIGRPLMQRYSIMLYCGYMLMALGYGALGLSYLGIPLIPAAARHLLLVGVLGVFVLTVISIVGRIHSGLYLDNRLWLPVAILGLIAVGLLRSSAGLFYLLPLWWPINLTAAVFWCLIIFIYSWHFLPIFFAHRKDGQHGCAGPIT